MIVPPYLEGIVLEETRRSGEAAYYKLPGELVLMVMSTHWKHVYRFIVQSARNSRIEYVEAKLLNDAPGPEPRWEFEYSNEKYAPLWLFRYQADAMHIMAEILERYEKYVLDSAPPPEDADEE